ncbi:MAG: hypothetical protein ACRD4R_09830 [Candidatus Acidiferrales bacterium]
MKVQLNLATAPQANNRPFLAASALVGAISLIALLLLAHATYSSWQDQRQLRSEINALQSRIHVSEIRQRQLAAYFNGPQTRRVLDRSAFLNSLIDERSFPWTRIFTDLERTLPPGVRVISISPRLDKDRAEVKLQVGAETAASEVQFLKAMETSHAFSGLVVKDVKPSSGTGAPGTTDQILIDLSVWYSTT